MVQSKSARRRRARKANSQVPYARMRPVSNWAVGSQALTATGQVVGGLSTPTSIPTFNPSFSGLLSVASGVPFTFQAAVISPGLSGSIPTIGRMRIDEIKGKILVGSAIPANRWNVTVGIYVSEFTQNTSAWDVYDPGNPADASRDDWWFLEAKCFYFPLDTTTIAAASDNMEMDISVKLNLVLGGGQALNVTVSCISDGGAGVMNVNPCFRTRIGPVA